jgi:hypothetical protein
MADGWMPPPDLKAAAGNLQGELRLEIDQIAPGSATEAHLRRVG